MVLATALLSLGAIQNFYQTAWDEYVVLYTGTAVPALTDVDGVEIAGATVSAMAGGRRYKTSTVPAAVVQNVAGVTETFGINNTWTQVFEVATACCRMPAPLSPAGLTAASCNNPTLESYAYCYTPTITVTGTTLTLTALRVAPVLTYAIVNGGGSTADGAIVALDAPYGGPAGLNSYSPTAPYRVQNRQIGSATPTSVTACGLIDNQLEAPYVASPPANQRRSFTDRVSDLSPTTIMIIVFSVLLGLVCCFGAWMFHRTRASGGGKMRRSTSVPIRVPMQEHPTPGILRSDAI